MYENNSATDPIVATGYDYDQTTHSLINKKTGEVFEAEHHITKAGSSTTTPEQLAQRKKYWRDQEGKSLRRLHLTQIESGLGNFVCSTCEGLDALSPLDVTHLTLLATHLRAVDGPNTGYLMETARRRMTKAEAQAHLEISRSGFLSFLSRMKASGYIEEHGDGLKITSNYWYGRQEDRESGWAQINKDPIRAYYQALPKSRRRIIGRMFMLLPKLHYKYNILCEFPENHDLETIKPYTLEECIKLLGDTNADRRTRAWIREAITETTFGDREDVIAKVIYKDSVEHVTLNPKVIYKSDWRNVHKSMVLTNLFAEFDSRIFPCNEINSFTE